EVPQIEGADPWNAGHTELEDRETSTRSKHACHLAARHLWRLHVANAEGNGGRIRAGSRCRDRCGITLHENDAASFTGGAYLAEPKPQHGAGEIHTEHTRRLTRFERHVPRAGADIDQRLASRETDRRDRLPPPSAIDAGAEKMIEEIVSRRD